MKLARNVWVKVPCDQCSSGSACGTLCHNSLGSCTGTVRSTETETENQLNEAHDILLFGTASLQQLTLNLDFHF